MVAMEQTVVYGGHRRRVGQRWRRVLLENEETDGQLRGYGLGLCCKVFRLVDGVPVTGVAVQTAEDAAAV